MQTLTPIPALDAGELLEERREERPSASPASPRIRWRPRRLLLGGAVLGAVALGVVGALGTAHAGTTVASTKPSATAPPPVHRPGAIAVVVATARSGSMPVVIHAIGTVVPLASVVVRTQVGGLLTRIGFTEGQLVAANDFLAEVDDRPYRAALAQAEAQRTRDAVMLDNARQDLARYRTLVTSESISQQQLDKQVALVAQAEANLLADQAQIDLATLNLGYCHITSPIAGRVGMRQVDPGNVVQTSDANGIVQVSQVAPISVVFSVPEEALPAIRMQVHAGSTLQVEVFDRGLRERLATGTVASLDNAIDATTGTIRLRAVFDNRDTALYPNQFVNVRLVVTTIDHAVLVPVVAIQHGLPGDFVFLVRDDSATVRTVRLGPEDGDAVAILDGVAPQDLVVTQGAERLKEASPVEVHTVDEVEAQEGLVASATAMTSPPRMPTRMAKPSAAVTSPPAATAPAAPSAPVTAPTPLPGTDVASAATGGHQATDAKALAVSTHARADPVAKP